MQHSDRNTKILKTDSNKNLKNKKTNMLNQQTAESKLQAYTTNLFAKACFIHALIKHISLCGVEYTASYPQYDMELTISNKKASIR